MDCYLPFLWSISCSDVKNGKMKNPFSYRFSFFGTKWNDKEQNDWESESIR